MNNFSTIESYQDTLAHHRVFQAIRSIDDLALFMSWHVFAVWDFMSLIKRLQSEVTCTRYPWIPPQHPLAARLINEIVRDEESDEMPGGGYLSHFEMYLHAMNEIGASTKNIEKFTTLIENGYAVDEALLKASAPTAVRTFVNHTMDIVQNGNVYQVLGNFFYGREHVIPQMFQGLLQDWNINTEEAPMFVYYLKRHIELDGDNHGPAARRLIEDFTENNPDAIKQIESSALDALEARTELWSGLEHALSMRISA